MTQDRLTLQLPFGHGQMPLELPAASLLGIFRPQTPGPQPEGPPATEAALVHQAMQQPIGTPRLCELARPGQRVAIVTSDLTRPCPSPQLLPAILAELATAGVRERDITVVVALGQHRPLSEAELEAAVGGGCYRRVRVINHDPADTVHLGTTSRGTPVELFRPLVEATLRICLGNLEFHYFAGYSGGAKAIVPGCASAATVTANHAMMVQPEAATGRLEGNPVRADIEEAATMLGVDFILNVVVDGEHRITAAVAGDVIEAHRAGCALVAARGCVGVPALADVVVASAGGHPKDVNLYQAQKALDNAPYALKEGGIVILVAECGEGCGHRTFEEWMTAGQTSAEILARIQEQFVLGGHKAAAIARVAERARIFLVAPALAGLSLTGMEHFATAQAALDAAFAALGPQARVSVLPEAASVLPRLGEA